MTADRDSATVPARRGWEHPVFMGVARVAVLYGFWLMLSGHVEIHFLVLGLLSAILAAWMTQGQLRPARTERFEPVPESFRWFLASLVRFIGYLPYLGYQIVRSNLEVAYLVLHPRLPISPRLVEFETPLKMEPAQVLLAQSITLTPGTITVDVRRGRFLVHSLYPGSAHGLTRGGMPRKVGQVFGTSASVQSSGVVHDVDNVGWFYEED